jgi:hypothetical protein
LLTLELTRSTEGAVGLKSDMAKKKISSADLIWIFHERLQSFPDCPLHGISIAIVPMPGARWAALTTRNVQVRRPLWAKRVAKIEVELRNAYILDSS